VKMAASACAEQQNISSVAARRERMTVDSIAGR
jgi:hypothetical protein